KIQHHRMVTILVCANISRGFVEHEVAWPGAADRLPANGNGVRVTQLVGWIGDSDAVHTDFPAPEKFFDILAGVVGRLANVFVETHWHIHRVKGNNSWRLDYTAASRSLLCEILMKYRFQAKQNNCGVLTFCSGIGLAP